MTGIGKTYNMPPQPADEAATTYLDAGAVSIGVEYRVVDPESLRETYQGNAAQLRRTRGALAGRRLLRRGPVAPRRRHGRRPRIPPLRHVRRRAALPLQPPRGRR